MISVRIVKITTELFAPLDLALALMLHLNLLLDLADSLCLEMSQ